MGLYVDHYYEQVYGSSYHPDEDRFADYHYEPEYECLDAWQVIAEQQYQEAVDAAFWGEQQLGDMGYELTILLEMGCRSEADADEEYNGLENIVSYCERLYRLEHPERAPGLRPVMMPDWDDDELPF